MSIFSGVNNPGISLNQPTNLEMTILAELAALGTPAGDRILFFDVSAGGYQFLTAGAGLDITNTTITATGPSKGFVIAMAAAL